jgi:hypothetical protein
MVNKVINLVILYILSQGSQAPCEPHHGGTARRFAPQRPRSSAQLSHPSIPRVPVLRRMSGPALMWTSFVNRQGETAAVTVVAAAASLTR